MRFTSGSVAVSKFHNFFLLLLLLLFLLRSLMIDLFTWDRFDRNTQCLHMFCSNCAIAFNYPILIYILLHPGDIHFFFLLARFFVARSQNPFHVQMHARHTHRKSYCCTRYISIICVALNVCTLCGQRTEQQEYSVKFPLNTPLCL